MRQTFFDLTFLAAVGLTFLLTGHRSVFTSSSISWGITDLSPYSSMTLGSCFLQRETALSSIFTLNRVHGVDAICDLKFAIV